MILKRRRFAVSAAALAVTAGRASGRATAAVKPLVHAIPADIASLDPADIRGQQAQELLCKCLRTFGADEVPAQPNGTLKADPTEVVPQLAES